MEKTIPFKFLLDYLPARVVIKPAIGMYYVYFEGKIVLIFRKVNKNSQHNGLWIAIKELGKQRPRLPSLPGQALNDYLAEL